MAEIETVLLLADDAGRFLGIADKPEPAEGQELIEWPVRKLAPRTPQAGGWEFASDVLSSDSAELGKIGSMDVIVQVAQYVAARDGWECYGVLPGQFGAAIYPPSVTVMFRRQIPLRYSFSEVATMGVALRDIDEIGPHPAGETA